MPEGRPPHAGPVRPSISRFAPRARIAATAATAAIAATAVLPRARALPRPVSVVIGRRRDHRPARREQPAATRRDYRARSHRRRDPAAGRHCARCARELDQVDTGGRRAGRRALRAPAPSPRSSPTAPPPSSPAATCGARIRPPAPGPRRARPRPARRRRPLPERRARPQPQVRRAVEVALVRIERGAGQRGEEFALGDQRSRPGPRLTSPCLRAVWPQYHCGFSSDCPRQPRLKPSESPPLHRVPGGHDEQHGRQQRRYRHPQLHPGSCERAPSLTPALDPSRARAGSTSRPRWASGQQARAKCHGEPAMGRARRSGRCQRPLAPTGELVMVGLASSNVSSNEIACRGRNHETVNKRKCKNSTADWIAP